MRVGFRVVAAKWRQHDRTEISSDSHEFRKWSDQIFLAQLDGLPIEALWKLTRCEDIKDCSESTSLIHKAIDRSNALSSKDVMAAYRVQTQDTTNPIHEIQDVAIEQQSNVDQVTVETKTSWWNPVRRRVAQSHTYRTKL